MATTLGTGLLLSVGFGVWASPAASPLTKATPPRVPSTGTGVERPGAASDDPTPGGPTSPGLAKQLRSKDPAALAKSVASEDATARSAPGQTRSTKARWLPGDVGTYLVGRGIPPGTYESAAPLHGMICQWARLKDLTGTKDDVLRSGSSNSRTLVTIHKTDGFFQTKDCANWRKIA